MYNSINHVKNEGYVKVKVETRPVNLNIVYHVPSMTKEKLI